jgi:GNAT superfamily N-acetyltransferase
MDPSHVDSNLFEFYDYAATAAALPCVEREGYSYIDLEPSPWAKAVYSLDFPADGALPAGLYEGISSGRIPNKIRVGPSSRPCDIESRLRDTGLLPCLTMRGMTLELQKRSRARNPDGLAIAPLEGEGAFADFAELVVAYLFKAKAETAPAFAKLLGSLGRDRAFGMLGRAEGEPASTAFAFLGSEGVGGLYFVATADGMRGRGYGAAIVGAVLDELERRGARACILQATELGKPVYERLGFEDACSLVNYALPG